MAQAEPLPTVQPEQEEALYLVDNTAYLHIQVSEAGYDYTLYDKAAMCQMDGGQIDPLDVDEFFSQGGLRPVADAVLISTPDLTGETVEEMPLELLKTLQEKALLNMRETAETQPPSWNETKELTGHFEREDAAALDTALDEYPMPDPAYSKQDVERDFAYLEGYLLPLSKERAEMLMEKDFSIYAIVNEYARMVFDREELDQCPPDITYAMPAGEWEESPEFHQAVAGRMNRQEERERAFLEHGGDCFAIYQIKDSDEQCSLIRFMNMDWLPSQGLSPDRANYELAYTGEMPCGLGSTALEKLYQKFNTDHPADYHRPSMSVSDILAVKQDGVVSCHYCNSIGFARVPDFLQPENYLKNAEMSLEDDLGMIGGIINNGPKATVAELEQQARSGQPISLIELAAATHREEQEKKQSVREKLKKQPKQEKKQTVPKKSVEKDR